MCGFSLRCATVTSHGYVKKFVSLARMTLVVSLCAEPSDSLARGPPFNSPIGYAVSKSSESGLT